MKFMRHRTLCGAGLLLLLALAFSACGNSGTSEGAGGTSSDKVAPVNGSGSSKDLTASTAVEDPSSSVGSVSESATLPDDFDSKIVKTADLGISSKHVRDTAADAQQKAASVGGNVLSSRISEGGDSVYADLVLSVPSEEFEKTLEDLRSLGNKVTTDDVTGQDVTEEYVDLKSRERNLLATEQSLLDLYDKADNVNDTLVIQRELTTVQGEIELVQGRIKYLDNRTAFSQITLNIQPVTPPAPPKPAWSPATVAAKAWSASLNVLQTLATAIISILAFGWWLTPILIAGYVWWRRRSIREPAEPASSEAP